MNKDDTIDGLDPYGIFYFQNKNPAGTPIATGGLGEDFEDYDDDEEYETLDCPNCGAHALQFIEWQGKYSLYNCDNCDVWLLRDYDGNLIDPEEAYLGEDIEKHDELNQKIFDDNNELKSEVKDKLVEIANKFISNLNDNEVDIDVDDIRIVGSNASYNYTKDSDIDLHLVADTSKYAQCEDLVQKLYDAYRSLWNNKYDPTIYGQEVEIYVEPKDHPAKSNGVYSLTDGWLKEPEHEIIPDNIDVSDEVEEFEDKASKCKTIEDIDDFLLQVYELRQKGLLEDGEYSKGNLTFKELRNHGILDELKQFKIDLINDELSLGD